MKIAQVTPLYEAVPPKLYGGTERVVAHLTDALVDLGHEVTLFASADALTKARLIPVRDQAIRLDPAPLKSDLAAHLTMLAEVMDRVDQFDVIHFHTDMIHFPMFRKYADKTLTTLHGRLDMKDLPEVYDRFTEFGLISISDDQRKPLAFEVRGLPRLPRPHLAGETPRPGDRNRHQAGQAAEDRGQGRCRRPGLLRRQDQAADRRQSPDRIHRRDR
jgi:glycosyltransferase involved in cell wall biosynthesis